jgi:hypothetical protein
MPGAFDGINFTRRYYSRPRRYPRTRRPSPKGVSSIGDTEAIPASPRHITSSCLSILSLFHLVSENFVSAIPSPQLNSLRPSGLCLPLFSFTPPFSHVNLPTPTLLDRPFTRQCLLSQDPCTNPQSFILDLPSLPCFTFACLASVVIVSLWFDISGTCIILI